MGDNLTQEQEYNKALFQFRSASHQVHEIYNVHGLGVYNEMGQIDAVMEKLALQLHARLMGIPDVNIGDEYEMVSIVSELPDD
jgi:hypothetical protein